MQINTSTGTQDITISGFGTPSAAIFILSGGAFTDSARVDGHFRIGATDGTRSRSASISSDDTVTTSDTGHNGSTDCVQLVNVAGSATLCAAGFSAWITDGVRINWTQVTGTALYMDVILIGGPAVLNARVDGFDLGTATTAQTVTCGFQADFVLAFGVNDVDGVGTHSPLCVVAYDAHKRRPVFAVV